jgi:hypothetical protein
MLHDLHECSEPPGEWIRIAAIRLALKYPHIEPCEAVRRAIDAFAVCAHLPPEEAAATHLS